LELETQILISEQLKYISNVQTSVLIQLSAEVGRMLNPLIESIRPNPIHRQPEKRRTCTNEV